MAYTVSKVEIWTGEIEDQVGGLAAKLEPLANAGADLEMVIARRQPDRPGKDVVFVGPVTGAKAQAGGYRGWPEQSRQHGGLAGGGAKQGRRGLPAHAGAGGCGA